jgi:tetraprenyl-beta-curcumene synthase
MAAPWTGPGRLALARAYAAAAARYWTRVFPLARRELGHWRARAERIPDPTLRDVALQAQRDKRSNVEGAAAFAVFAPRACRKWVVRAEVAFQVMFDYLDTLSEQPSEHASANAAALHRALLVALDPGAPPARYCDAGAHGADSGYLGALVQRCRQALGALPSYAAVGPTACGLADDLARYQTLNLSERHGGHSELRRWAESRTTHDAALSWWEAAAGASSTLSLLALMVAAARPATTPEDARRIAAAYRPWVEALHSMLDSTVDQAEDAAAGQRSPLSYYGSPEEATTAMGRIASEATRALGALPDAVEHLVLLAGLVGNYGADAHSTLLGRAITRAVAEALSETIGFLALPTALVFRARRAVQRGGRGAERLLEPTATAAAIDYQRTPA